MTPRRPGVRLPLIDEYAGACHASGTAAQAVDTMISTGCNQGYAESCPNHPASGAAAAMRYTVTGESDGILTLTWIEEQAHAPLRWGRVRFDADRQCLLDLPFPGPLFAQITVFCRSYLARRASQGLAETTSDRQSI